MKTTVFTCDICKESKSKEDLVTFKIQVDGGLRLVGSGTYNRPLEKDICKECLRKKGFEINPPSADEENQESAKANAKTLESKLFDILEDLGVAFVE